MSTLTTRDVLSSYTVSSWNTQDHLSVVPTLEAGKVVFLPHLAFPLMQDELPLLTASTVEAKRKNISYHADQDRLTGVASPENAPVIRQLLLRHHQACQQLVDSLLPEYRTALVHPTNTLRVHPVKQWQQGASWRKDDTRLHVDAFPSRPNSGQRIVRIFTNINPHGEARVWRIGQPFPSLVEQFLPRITSYSALASWFQHKFKITKGMRSHYDQIMLNLHDAMKADLQYQAEGPQVSVSFPAGSSWICFSDQTPHAAMSGQFLLEQTYMLPVEAMCDPNNAPRYILEKMLQKRLA